MPNLSCLPWRTFLPETHPILTWQAWARTAATCPTIRSHHQAAAQSSKRSQVQARATATGQRVLQGSTHSRMTQPASSKQVTSTLRRDHRLNLPAAKVQPLPCWLLLFLAFCLTLGSGQRLPVVLLLQSRILHCQNAVFCSVGLPSLLSTVLMQQAAVRLACISPVHLYTGLALLWHIPLGGHGHVCAKLQSLYSSMSPTCASHLYTFSGAHMQEHLLQDLASMAVLKSAASMSQWCHPIRINPSLPLVPIPLRVIDTIDMLTDSPLPVESADHSKQRSAADVHHLHPNSVTAPTPSPPGRPQFFRPHFTPLPMQQLARPASPFQRLLTCSTSPPAAAAHLSPAQHSSTQFVAAQRSHAQHSPAQHSPAQHSSAELSADMLTSDSTHHRAKKRKTGKDHLVTCLDAFDSISHAGTIHQPAVLAKHAHSAAQQEGMATELLHGDSILSSDTHIHVDMPPLNGPPTGQRSDLIRFFTPPLANAASPSPKGCDLKKKCAAETGQTSAAASHAPMTDTGGTKRRTAPMTDDGAASKKSASLADGAHVKKTSAKAGAVGVANAAGRGSRKRKTDGSQVDGDALAFDFDAVLSGMPEDLGMDMGMDVGMDIDGSSFAELTAGFTAPCLNAPPSGGRAQHLQPAEAPLNPSAGTSRQQQKAAASIQQRRAERNARASGAASGSRSYSATQAAHSSVNGAAVGGGLLHHKRALRGEARNAGRTAAPTSSGHRSRVSPQRASPTPSPKMPFQAATRYPTQVQGQKPGATREYYEGQMVWAQPKGYTFWPAMVSCVHESFISHSLICSALLAMKRCTSV